MVCMRQRVFNQLNRSFSSASESAASTKKFEPATGPAADKCRQTLALIYASPHTRIDDDSTGMQTNSNFNNAIDHTQNSNSNVNARNAAAAAKAYDSSLPRRLQYNYQPNEHKFTRNWIRKLKLKQEELEKSIAIKREKAKHQDGVDPKLGEEIQECKKIKEELGVLVQPMDMDQKKPPNPPCTDAVLKHQLKKYNAEKTLSRERLHLWSTLESYHRMPEIMSRRPSGKRDAMRILHRQRSLPYARSDDPGRFERLKTLWTFSNSHGVSWDELDEEYIRWAEQGHERRRKWAEYAQRKANSVGLGSVSPGSTKSKEQEILGQVESISLMIGKRRINEQIAARKERNSEYEDPTDIARATMDNAIARAYMHRWKQAYLQWHRPGQLIRHLREYSLTRANQREMHERFGRYEPDWEISRMESEDAKMKDTGNKDIDSSNVDSGASSSGSGDNSGGNSQSSQNHNDDPSGSQKIHTDRNSKAIVNSMKKHLNPFAKKK